MTSASGPVIDERGAWSPRSPRPLRLLVLAPFPPSRHATHGGGRVIAALVRRLAARHRVVLLHLATHEEPGADDGLRDACERVERVELPWGRPWPARLAGRVRAGWRIARGWPGWVAGWDARAMHALVRRTVDEWRPDVVQFEFQVMGQYVRALGRARPACVLTVHEPGATASGAGRAGSPARWERYERWLFPRMSAVTTFTARDAAVIAPLAKGTTVETIPLGVEADGAPLSPDGDGATVLFAGNFRHPPNVDSAVRLGREIWPSVAARVPAARLTIVGVDPTADVRALASARVEVVGQVPDVAPYLDRASVVVAPARTGGGMRVKALEALAAGKALVATPLACEGIPVEPGVHALVAAEGPALADAIVTLLQDGARRRRMAAAAREFAVSRLAWEPSVARYEQLYARLLAAPPETRP